MVQIIFITIPLYKELLFTSPCDFRNYFFIATRENQFPWVIIYWNKNATLHKIQQISWLFYDCCLCGHQGTEGAMVTRKLGNQALQLNVFHFSNDLLSHPVFSGKTVRIHDTYEHRNNLLLSLYF